MSNRFFHFSDCKFDFYSVAKSPKKQKFVEKFCNTAGVSVIPHKNNVVKFYKKAIDKRNKIDYNVRNIVCTLMH